MYLIKVSYGKGDNPNLLALKFDEQTQRLLSFQISEHLIQKFIWLIC